MVGGGGVVTFEPCRGGEMLSAYPVGQTDACENITFALFATRVVTKLKTSKDAFH